jgi:hypothetical protein
MEITLLLGNTSVLEDGQPVDLGNRITEVKFPEGYPAADQLPAIKDLWPSHSDAGPEWVECDDDPLLAQMVARTFTTPDHECVVGRPKGWKES